MYFTFGKCFTLYYFLTILSQLNVYFKSTFNLRYQKHKILKNVIKCFLKLRCILSLILNCCSKVICHICNSIEAKALALILEYNFPYPAGDIKLPSVTVLKATLSNNSIHFVHWIRVYIQLQWRKSHAVLSLHKSYLSTTL